LDCGRSLVLFGVHFVDGDKRPLLDLLVCHRRDSILNYVIPRKHLLR
jgi:hypothetical protein